MKFIGLLTGTVMHSSSPCAVLRQSSRQRVAPLRWWANERILACPITGMHRIVSGNFPDMSDVTGKVGTWDVGPIWFLYKNNRK